MNQIELDNEALGALAVQLKHALLEAATRRQEAGKVGHDTARIAADETIYQLNKVMHQIEPLYEALYGRLR